MTTNSNHQPIGLKWRSNTTFILSTVTVGMFTDLFLYGLVVPILPFILSDRLNIPQQEVQWWTSVLLALFAGSSVVFSLPIGFIADKLPARQLPFLLGLTALLTSTGLLYLGQTIEILILARILQGMSAAVVWTVGFALIMDTVRSDQLGVVIGTIFSFVDAANLLAPVVGGIVYKKAGDGATFGMGVGLLAIDFLMRLAVIEKKTAKKHGVVYDDTEELNEDEEANEDSLLLENGGHKKAEQWIIPDDLSRMIRTFPILYCMKHPRWLVAELVCFIQAALIGTFDATLTTEAQVLFNFDSLKAGLLFVPLVIPSLFYGPIAGKGVDRYGPRIFASAGFLFMAIPLLLLRIPHEGGTLEIIKLASFLTLAGFGLATLSSPGLVESSYVIEQYHKHNKDYFSSIGPWGQQFAINNVVFSLGLTLGPLIAGTLKDSIGYGNMNAVFAGICIVISMMSWKYFGEKPKRVQR